jgi:hypothetical protein
MNEQNNNTYVYSIISIKPIELKIYYNGLYYYVCMLKLNIKESLQASIHNTYFSQDIKLEGNINPSDINLLSFHYLITQNYITEQKIIDAIKVAQSKERHEIEMIKYKNEMLPASLKAFEQYQVLQLEEKKSLITLFI